ncbi:aminopeptidase Ey-like [Aulostomus maculatus]
MGKGFFVSKSVGVVAIILGAGALATIIALSVVYSQEKAKNNDKVLPTDGVTTPKPTPTPSNNPWDKYRLPKSLVPEVYNVTLWPRLTEDEVTGLYIFTGEVGIQFLCVEETDLIIIHSNKLNYTTAKSSHLATVTALGAGYKAPSIVSSWLQPVTQYLVLKLSGPLMKDNSYILHAEFIGELSDDLGGFYRSEYIEDGVKKIVATTQMQPTDARKAFPCFDEPAMKAVFNISLIHDPGMVALSNSEEKDSTDIVIDGKNLRKTEFKPTEKMSTYLLAFIVSDFGFINNTIDGVLIRIFARKPAILARQGDYALNKTGPILKFFEKYYNSTYPLPKSDQIALPDFNAGAMENWGLITYRETVLLYDQEFSSNSNKERITTIIAHELAHMWFGNLVTLRWWNDLWLNEGFASYVEYLGAHEAEKTWNVKDLIVLNDMHRVFAVDALASSHPLSSKEEDIQRPEQISELFDAISYSKGASVLRMLSDFLTEDVFTKGLRTYLAEFAFGNAVYTDLWRNLQMAVDGSSTDLPGSVHEIMNTWVLQMGFPVVTINTTTGAVSQKHFLLDPESEVTTPSPYNYKWIIPIQWMKTEVNQTAEWLTAESATIESMKTLPNEWVLANLNVVGYYRVNYDQENWEKLLNRLSSNHKVIPVINRAQLLDDAFNLARAKIVPTVLALRTTKYLSQERDYIPWASATNNLDFFYLMFDRTEVYGPMQDYLRKQVIPLFDHFRNTTDKWPNVPEGHMDQYSQVSAVSLACRTGYEDCLNLTTTWFTQWMTTKENMINPNLRSTVYCNAIASGGAKEWEFAWTEFKKTTIASEAEKLRSALACTKQPWLLNRYLEYTLNPAMIRKQDATSTIVYIASNVIGQPLAWDFIRAHWSQIFSQYGGRSFSFSNLINGVTKRFSTEFDLQQLKQFKADNAEVGFGSGTLAVDQSIERTVANIKWISENKKSVLDWFVAETKPIMAKRCRTSRLCIFFLVLASVSVATIVTLWTITLTGGGDDDDVTAPWDRYRLPSALVPDHYNITLWPRLSPDPSTGLYFFTGKSTVEFVCTSETDLILIHSNKLNYTRLEDTHIAMLTASGGGSAPSIKSSRLQLTTQYLIIHLNGKLHEGQTYRLYTEFTGELSDDLAGFYRSEYEEDGEQKIVATSQMHPTHARKTFPCFDEPAMKAFFHITLIHPPGTVALSNGMERDIVNITIDGVEVTQTRFEPTKKMSTYLLAIVVSDFSHLRATQGDTLIRIWARRKAIEQGHGDYALNVTGPVLDFFQRDYNISYPLSKSDQVALPDFYFGAMENWGLVTYRETRLLYDNVTSSNRNKETTVSIIAHELAHMWFGNLVTLRWWNEVWLNEGFATYVSYLGADFAEPAWNMKDLILLDDIHKAFAVDALASSHPLSSKEDSIILPDQIMEQFDTISYSKGAAVLRMLSGFLSEQVFVQGLSSYLKQFAYSSTVGNDLWDKLEMAVKANNVSLPGRVHEIMNRWVLQMGFPVVNIDTATGEVSQRHFLLDPESNVTVPNSYEWQVPVWWMKSSEHQTDVWWLMEKTAVNPDMRSSGSWVLANINVTGYYRVNYDLGNWERLLLQLRAEHQVIPLLNRAQLVDDAFNLARAQLVSSTLALRTTSYLSGETEYIPWQSALDNLHYYYLMLDQTEVYPPMQEYMKHLVTPLYLYFQNMTSDWTLVPDKHTDQYNQVNAIRMACSTGVTQCQNLTSTWFKQWMNNPQENVIHPNLRSAVYCSAIAAGDEAEWEFGWSQFMKASTASEASKLMSALACPSNTQLLRRYLSYTLNPAMIRKQDATSVITSVASNRAGQSLAWDFVREQWEYMFTQYGVGSFSFASMIGGVTARFSTPAQLQQLEEFVKEHGEDGFGSASLAVEQALERTRSNIKWLQQNKEEILDWFTNQAGHQKSP